MPVTHIQTDPENLTMTLVADFAAQAALDSGALVPVLPDWRLTGNYAPRTAYALYMPSRHVPLKVRALIDHLALRLSAERWGG